MRSVALTRQAFPFALALLAGALLTYTPARGVTLGNISSHSALGQPLRVVIPVMLTSGETLNNACVKLVADNTSDAPQITTGRVSLEQATTRPRLVITTASVVNEPAIRLAVQAGCGSTSRRDYVLLLDPAALESKTPMAVAEADEPVWLSRPVERASSHPSANPNRIASTRPEPTPPLRLSSWGTPVATGPVTAERPAAEISPALKPIETKAPESIVASAPPPASAPPQFVTMMGASGAFIPEAAAAPLTPRIAPSTSLRQTTTPRSIPLVSNPQSQFSSGMTLWRQTWQYVVVAGVAAIMLAFGAFVVRRRSRLASTWFTTKDQMSLKGETEAGPAPVTFAHFGQMTEPASIRPRAPIELPELSPDDSAATTELDTLLHDIQSDMVDEQTVKDAWKAAATDAAMDPGTDSILRAIAAAERDLEIGTREPAQFTMDTTLDELLTVPNKQTKAR